MSVLSSHYKSLECSVHFLRCPWLETGKCEIVGLQTAEKIHGYYTPESWAIWPNVCNEIAWKYHNNIIVVEL